jgi:hypothetical protein
MPNRTGDNLSRLIARCTEHEEEATGERLEEILSLTAVLFSNRNRSMAVPWIKAACDIHLGPAFRSLLRIIPFRNFPAHIVTSPQVKTNPLVRVTDFSKMLELKIPSYYIASGQLPA